MAKQKETDKEVRYEERKGKRYLERPRRLLVTRFLAYPDVLTDDDECDLQFNNTKFSWVSTGHASEANARASWQGVDPSGKHIFYVAWQETDQFDQMKSRWNGNVNIPKKSTPRLKSIKC